MRPIFSCWIYWFLQSVTVFLYELFIRFLRKVLASFFDFQIYFPLMHVFHLFFWFAFAKSRVTLLVTFWYCLNSSHSETYAAVVRWIKYVIERVRDSHSDMPLNFGMDGNSLSPGLFPHLTKQGHMLFYPILSFRATVTGPSVATWHAPSTTLVHDACHKGAGWINSDW